ncbi:unnamed protein product [Allacma fusca]|uniref:Membrane-associated protein Hem n=1 Tax=Allacma fusca TaxID=39272 RepID=A0A8J2KZ12_9HEXA|nr:unnamed protein product [Allacma fusca]
MEVTQQKLAEKLTILNDRGVGLLTRLYNIKKACGDTKSKPGFLSEKTLESSIKHIVKRFPNIDIKQVQNIGQYRAEITKTLHLYYYTFVDLLDFKDHVSELLTIMDACQVELDITLNFDLTKGYLDLVITYTTLMILLSRVEDRKAVLGLFHVAQEMASSPADTTFPRLGQMILEYDPPLKKLSEEFGPHSKLLIRALISLQQIYPRRNLEADTLRKKQMLSLTAQPGYLLIPARTDTTPCEYLSLDTMERWIIFGFMLCHHALGNANIPASDEMWLAALKSSWVVTLFRDEVLYTHSYINGFFDTIKGYNKRISEVKDAGSYAVQHAALMHRERRKFFRTALKEMALVMTDQPGLLGPKALYVFMGLCYARDEVVWLLRHHDNPPLHKGKSKATEDLIDRQLPELLFHMEELRALVRKYSQVIQRYYVQYLSCYDGPALGQLLGNFAKMENESMILASIYSTISNLSVKQVEDNEIFDFRGIRLDWYRLQSFLSHTVIRIQGLSYLMNTSIFHLKLVDFQDELLLETSDLSLFCFYNKIFEDQFHMCLEFPAQNRYIVAFPLICSHFQNCTHEMCPEERHHIRERSLSVVNIFLDEMAKEAKNIITTICDEQCTLSDKLLPKHCAALIAHHLHRKKAKDKNKKPLPEINKPGVESFRKTREDLTTMDKLHMALTELCYAINYCPSISVWEYTFAPKEYLHQHLESRFARALVGMVMFSPDTNEIAKPSELLASVRAYMNVLQTVENYVHLDMTRVFNNVLLQQTQQMDSHGEKTVAVLYTQWYSEVLLRRVSAGNIIFSGNQKAFVSLTAEGSVPFSAEEFSDITELRALAELIGPYGMKHLNETLMWHIAGQVQELKKMVSTNKDILLALRTNFDKPENMKELFKKLINVENVLQRMTIIGMILRFRQLTQEALHDTLIDRIPFLLSSILEFHEHAPNGESINVAEMASAAGIPMKVDPTLVHALRSQKNETGEDEYTLACLLMVFVAVSIPKLARIDVSVYRASLEGHSNNIHCLAAAVNAIFGALFSICGQGDIEERLKEFLALASSSLLRLGQEADKEAVKNRESVYLLLDMIVQESPFLTMDLLESCFPYALIRNAFHAVCS